MSTVYLSEIELKKTINKIYKEEQQKVVLEKWNKLSDNDKRFVLEFLKIVYPEKAQIIREGKWYNTLGDIMGIFDPTGVVDLINGISYWRQGDKLFAILSWISVIPYVGDLIGKSVLGLFKMGKGSARLFKAASKAGDYTKMAEIAQKSGPLKNLVTKVGNWAPKILEPLKKIIGKVPGIGPGFIRAVEDFIKLFKNAGKTMEVGTQTAVRLTQKSTFAALSKAEKKQLANAIEQATNFRGFRDFGGGKSWLKYMKSDASFMSKLSAGVPRLWGNPATRSLMRRTKWYLGFLDFLGLTNFTGNPEDLEKEVPDLDSKLNEYNKTDAAMNNLSSDLEDLGTEEPSMAPPPPPPSPETSNTNKTAGSDFFSNFINSTFSGAFKTT